MKISPALSAHTENGREMIPLALPGFDHPPIFPVFPKDAITHR